MDVCVMASGPSMCREDAERVSQWRNGTDRLAFAVNNTFLLCPAVDVIFATDRRWWNHFLDQARETGAELWCQCGRAGEQYDINVTPWTSDSGNSGERALRLAAQHYQATRIILLGFDMQDSPEKHWHGPHPKGWPNPDASAFKQWREWIARLVREHPTIEWINATRKTAIPAATIPRMTLEDALN